MVHEIRHRAGVREDVAVRRNGELLAVVDLPPDDAVLRGEGVRLSEETLLDHATPVVVDDDHLLRQEEG